jgi:hypothetical protein
MKLLVSACFILFALLTMTGCENSHVSASGAPDSSIPAQQNRFCQIIKNVPIEKERIENLAQHEPNPFKRKEISDREWNVFPQMFETLHAFIGPSGTFTNWRARLRSVGPAERNEHSLRIVFAVDCGDYNPRVNSTPILIISTLKGIREDTDIAPSNPLYRVIKEELDYRKKTFTVSGQFIWVPPPLQGQVSLTSDGRLDGRYHFYPMGATFLEGHLDMVVRFTSIN